MQQNKNHSARAIQKIGWLLRYNPMRQTFFIMSLFFVAACNSGNEYPKREDNRLYTTDSTYYLMNDNDTLSKLMNDRTLEVAE